MIFQKIIRGFFINYFNAKNSAVTFASSADFAVTGFLVAGIAIWWLQLVNGQLGGRLVLSDTATGHIAGVGQTGVKDDKLVHTLVQFLDLNSR